ncbi:hypothetical protein ACI782_22150 [Geodermatophilus sp. SYSU D00703]
MGWYGWNHMSGWGWFTMTVSALLLLALVVGGIVALARVAQQPSVRTPPQPAASPPPRPAEDVLAERLARGEISVDEYRERLAALSSSGQGAPPR